MAIEESHKLIILGNGHNLAMGLRTSFDDFAGKYFSQQPKGTSQLEMALRTSYMTSKSKLKKWCDLEGEIKRFALSCNPSSINPQTEYMYFQNLRVNIGTYMDGEDKFQFLSSNLGVNPKFERTLPYFFFNSILEQDRHYKVLSFNYSDLQSPLITIAKRMISTDSYTQMNSYQRSLLLDKYVHERFDVQYLHLDGRDCILGIDDDPMVPRELNFLKKSFQFKESCHYPIDFENYDSVIFYGHSLGETDADFLKLFFTDVMKKRPNQNMKIIFVTVNDLSKTSILNNLSNILGASLTEINKHLHYEFILDDGIDAYKTRSLALRALMC